MSVARKILSNTSFQIMGKAATALLSVAVMKIISVYLGTAGAGQYTTVYEFLAFFGIIADLGLYTIAVREMSADEDRMPMIIGNILGMRTFLVVLAMSLAVLAAFLIPKYQGTLIPFGVAIASIGTLFTIINGTISSVLQVQYQMKYQTVGLVIGKAVSVAYMIYAAFIAFTADPVLGFYHLMLAGIIGNAVMLLITWHFTSRFVRIRYRFDGFFWKKVFVTALPYGVALFLNTIYFRIDTIMMSLILRTDPSLISQTGTALLCHEGKNYMTAECQIGFYSVAMRMTEVLLIIPVYFMNSVLPVLTKYLKEATERVRMLLQYSFDFITALALPIVVGGYILAYPLVFIVSDPEFLSNLSVGVWGSDIALKVLLFAMLFAFVNAMFGILLVVVNKQTRLLYINGAAVIINLLTNLAVIPVFGFRGAAATSVATEFFILICTFIVAKKYLPLNLNYLRTLKMIFSALVMGVVIYLSQPLTYGWMENKNVLILVPLGGLVYSLMLLVTKSVDEDMRRIILKR